MNNRLIYLVVTVLTTMLMACTEQTPKYRIGVSQCSGGMWRDKQNSEMQRELLLHDGITMELACAEDDADKQVAQIRHFINERVDIIVASPYIEEKLKDIIAEAYDSGIPVVLFDRIVSGDKFTAFVGCNNVGVGERLADYAVSCLPDGGNVVELTGDLSTVPAQRRHLGITNELSRHKNITLLASKDANWNGPMAGNIMDSMLNCYPKIDVVVAHSDWMASTAREHARKSHPDRNIKFVGADGFGTSGIGIYAVADGNIDATVVYPTGGNVIIETAIDILEGRTYKREVPLPSFIVSKPKEAQMLVTMDNELQHEVKTIVELKDRIIFFNDQMKSEELILITVICFLILAVAFVLVLYRMFRNKRKTNEVLQRQQAKLTAQRDQLLAVTKELEEATLAKLRFFTNVSHDFRTPLTLISTPLDEMASHESSPLLDIARRNVKILLRLINQILDFQKYQSGNMTLVVVPVNLKQYIGEWIASFRAAADQRGIKLKFINEGQTDDIIMTDIGKIERIFYNIMGNAMKFTPDNGTITISYQRNQHDINLSIADTGAGIDSQHLQRLFDRFYQADSSHYDGSGIGLALVKSFMDMMNGTATVASNTDPAKGQTGTTITLTIPAETTSEAPETWQPTATDNSVVAEQLADIPLNVNSAVDTDEVRPVLLVIDDNADLLAVLKQILGADYHVLTALGGSQGITLAHENIPDLILCDVMMPEMDGLECCRQLKNDIRTSHIPIVLLTACSLDEQRVKGLKEGAEAYLSKPFSMPVLRAQIDALIHGRQLVRNHYTANPASATHADNPADNPADGISPYDQDFVERLRKNINDFLTDDDFNVETLAMLMSFSRVQLYRKCKALTQCTPIELIRNMRLERGRQLLSDGHTTISAAAKAVGFSDPAYFSRCYKAYFGESPKNPSLNSKSLISL